jgi:peptidoglycan/LPS O-acetylase OafA/YrhL
MEHRRDLGPILWKLGLAVFAVSLVLPIRKDWSEPQLGGWWAYLMGLCFAPMTLVVLPLWLTGNGPATGMSGRDAIESVFLLTWFANPLCHAATFLLWFAPRRRTWARVLTALALALSVTAGCLNVGSDFTSLQRSPAYFAWTASMGLMFLAALCPAPREPEKAADIPAT